MQEERDVTDERATVRTRNLQGKCQPGPQVAGDTGFQSATVA